MNACLLPVILAFPASVEAEAAEDMPAHQLGSDRWHFDLRINALAAAPSGDRVAVSAGPAVVIVDPRTGEHLFRHEASCSPLDALAWTPQGLVAGCNNLFFGGPRLFRWEEGESQPTLAVITAGPVVAVDLREIKGEEVIFTADPAGQMAAFREGTPTQRAYAGQLSRRRPLDPRIAAAGLQLHPAEAWTITSESDLLITTGQHRDVLTVRDLTGGGAITTGHGASITESAVSPDGQHAATIDFEGEVRIWRIADGAMLHRWRVDPPQRHVFAFDDAFVGWLGPDTLLAGSGSGGVFQLQPGRNPARRLEKKSITHVRLDAAGRRGLFLDHDGRVAVRALGKKDKTLWTLKKIEGQDRRVQQADISADGSRVLLVTSQISVHDGATGAVIWRGPGRTAALSADGRTLAVAREDGVSVRTLIATADAPEGSVIARFEGRATALALDAGGTEIAIADPDGITRYRIADQQMLADHGDLPDRAVWLRYAEDHLLARTRGAPSVRVFAMRGEVEVAAAEEIEEAEEEGSYDEDRPEPY